MSNILDIAKYIAFNYKKIFGEVIDEMKLHKLLYFAQRECLAKYNEPLFEENFEAWCYGPVSKEIRNNIQDIISNDILIDIDKKDIVNDIILQYAPINSKELSQLSHNESSWKNARKGLKETDKSNNSLSVNDIKNDGKKSLTKIPFIDYIDKNTINFIDNVDESELTEFVL